MSLAMKTESGTFPPFTDKQTAAIRKIARKAGVPAGERADFVQSVWLEVARCQGRVPEVEPDRSKYVNGVAAHMASDLRRERERDVLANAVAFDALPARTAAREPLSNAQRILAREAIAAARARDPQGAEWMVRDVVHEEPYVVIADDAGVPADRVRKRVSRLLEYLRIHLATMSLWMLILWATVGVVLPSALRPPPPPPAVPPEVETAAPVGPSPAERASALRAQAFEACRAQSWRACAEGLDQAAALDPDGESAPSVRDARAAIAEAARRPEPRGPAKPMPR